MNKRTNDHPTFLGIACSLVIGLVFWAFVSESIVRIAMPNWQEFYNGRFMRVINVSNHGLVATGLPGFNGYFSQNNGDFRVRLKINNFGYRNPDPVEKAKGRVWFVGDSMAFGWGVEQSEMYSTVVENLLNLPTFNISSPGTNVCGYQALLARTLKHASPRALIVGLILENDLNNYNCRAEALKSHTNIIQPKSDVSLKSVNSLKIWLMQKSALYNFMAISLKRVSFINKFLTRLGLVSKVHAHKPVHSLDKFDLVVSRTAAELENLRSQISAGIPFAVLIAPARFEIRDLDKAYQRVRKEMIRALTDRGIAVIDPIDRFLKTGFEATHFPHDGHWSALGHKVAAQAVAEWLRNQNIGK